MNEQEPFNELTPAQVEALALIIEECAEVQHAATKILRHGLIATNPLLLESVTNQEDLARELGDVIASISLLDSIGLIDGSMLSTYAMGKIGRLPQYLHHIEIDTREEEVPSDQANEE
jgi:NTP pyrophosphatase (non-canonical NTP hydrolase)